MEIKVSDLKPNPFRNIDNYPIVTEKVDALKASIEETTFWDNLLARPNPDGEGYQLAYGHHRWVALKELGIKKIDIPVRDLDDATMLQIMANENLSDWAVTSGIINETVFAAKNFLDSTLAECETIEEYHGKISRVLFKGKKGDFKKCQATGVGLNVIQRFLGKNWSEGTIKYALGILNDKEIDRSACEVFEKPIHADTFRDLCGKQTHRFSGDDMARSIIPDLMFKTKEEQKNMAVAIKQRLNRNNIEITKGAIKTEFGRIVAEKRDVLDEELIIEMTDEDLVRESLTGKINDLENILNSFVIRIKKLKKYIVKVGRTKSIDKKTFMKKSSFHLIVDLLEEALKVSGFSLGELLKEREEKS